MCCANGHQCDVLEIGFGCGYSAACIQSYKPRSHTIVECSVAVLKRLHRWAEGKRGIVIIEGTWQDAMPLLGRFDALFFDDFPLPTSPSDLVGGAYRPRFVPKRRRLSLPPPRYSLPRGESRVPASCGASTPSAAGSAATPPPADEVLRSRPGHPLANRNGAGFVADAALAALDTRWTVIVNLCAEWHMRPGARLTGYLARQCKISHPHCSVEVTTFQVDPPPHCPYFSGTHLYVPRVTLNYI